MLYGYMGKILRVDLSQSKISQEAPSQDVLKKFLGGSGLATRYLFDEVPKGADPLGPENELIFMAGPLTGTPSPSGGRYEIVAKSPLTGFWGGGNSGGEWGVHLKRSGFDGIIFKGVAPQPVYLVIDAEKVELKDAKDIWGKSVSETTRLIKEKHGEEFRVACIGIGGENKVRYACIMNDVYRAVGRCGLGAVMGSKRLKAIAVRGAKRAEAANKQAFTQVSRKNYDFANESIMKMTLGVYGTSVVADMVNIKGGYPTKNWQTGVFSGIEEINGVAITDKLLTARKACYSCPIACGRITEVKTGKYAYQGEGPEYECVGAFGGMCGNNDLEAISYITLLSGEYGVDCISAGSTIAFAMECYEKGILTKSETDGLELKFGDPEVTLQLLHKIAKREGIGDLLAEGTKRVSEKLGRGTQSFAMHVKGLEMPAYDSRAAKITGLSYATANRGGDHITAYAQGPTFMDIPFMVVEESKIEDALVENPKEAKVVKDMEDAFTVFDCMGTCKNMGMCLTAEDWVDMITNYVGWKFDVADFRKLGERVYNLARAFNIREGLTRADDTLPKRLLEEPLPEGLAKGHRIEHLAEMLDAYYEFRGWDKETGKPTPGKLRELGLEEIIAEVWLL